MRSNALKKNDHYEAPKEKALKLVVSAVAKPVAEEGNSAPDFEAFLSRYGIGSDFA